MRDALDICTCCHARDEHADFGGVCMAWDAEEPVRRFCSCDRYNPEQDDDL